MNRRQFLTTSLGLAAGMAIPARAQAQQNSLRTITYNILACRGFPENRSNRERLQAAKSQIPERTADELALYQPDIVTFQEGPAREVVAAIADRLGMNHVFFQGGWGGDKNYPGGFPGAVLTRFDIVESANCPVAGGGARPADLFTRHWGTALLDTPLGRLPVFSAHLHPSDQSVRLREADEALKVIRAGLDTHGTALLQGDLNHTPDAREYLRWQRAGLVDCFAKKGEGKQQRTFSSPSPRSRIDYVWAGGKLAERVESSRILWEGGFRTNPDDPASFALSDHVPVMADFSG